MIVLSVHFPPDVAVEPNAEASIDLWTPLAFSFFLEALYKGNSLFNGREFVIEAYDANEVKALQGRGIYTVVDRELIVHDESGTLTDITAAAWRDMKRRISH